MLNKNKSYKSEVTLVLLATSFLFSIVSMIPRIKGDYLGYIDIFSLENFHLFDIKNIELYKLVIAYFSSITYPDLGFFIFNVINFLLVLVILRI